MRTNSHLISAALENYALIMNADKNPLRRLPPAQRFQIMIYLSVMWTTIFCAAFGIWYWYGQLVGAHLLVALGLLLTSITFSRAGWTRNPEATIKKLL